jgi:hypothetical protein
MLMVHQPLPATPYILKAEPRPFGGVADIFSVFFAFSSGDHDVGSPLRMQL